MLFNWTALLIFFLLFLVLIDPFTPGLNIVFYPFGGLVTGMGNLIIYFLVTIYLKMLRWIG